MKHYCRLCDRLGLCPVELHTLICLGLAATLAVKLAFIAWHVYLT